ncbi:MAG: hypothetical protein AAFW81_07565 [Pseudomonadota bacterium]
MSRIAIATCLKQPELTPSDRLLAAALNARGASVVAAPWNGEFAPFAEADLTLIRSTWDYFDVTDAFTGWIGRLEGEACVLNPAPVLRWNMTKSYLFDLAEKGGPVPPSRRIAPTPDAIAQAMDALKIDEAIVKPLSGGTASGLSRVARNDPAAIARAAEILNGPSLVQPFLPDIVARGETSFVFLDGDFSHAVLKRPKSGDIRVQEDHGGSSTRVEAPEWAVEEAARILSLCPEGAAYARVDAIVTSRELTLMEIELVEPELFFPYCPEAADRFAAALLRFLDAQ